jgi:hypothetical protein
LGAGSIAIVSLLIRLSTNEFVFAFRHSMPAGPLRVQSSQPALPSVEFF